MGCGMIAFKSMPADVCSRVVGVFLDIDDTLTTRGRLTARAYAAMERLQAGGVKVIPITGRPAGWCDHIARLWPVDAVVGENGSFYFRYDRRRKKLERRFYIEARQRRKHRERLSELGKMILSEVPGCALASEQAYRESDLAVDYCEDVPRISEADVVRIVELFQRAGANAKVSSIHVNGWFGDYDKLSMTRILMRECFGVDLDADRGEYVFVGDSPNDAPMFGYFPSSIGVANVADFGERVVPKPAYVTAARCGAGFVEVVDGLLANRL